MDIVTLHVMWLRDFVATQHGQHVLYLFEEAP
jgi:hypothetical protein